MLRGELGCVRGLSQGCITARSADFSSISASISTVRFGMAVETVGNVGPKGRILSWSGEVDFGSITLVSVFLWAEPCHCQLQDACIKDILLDGVRIRWGIS